MSPGGGRALGPLLLLLLVLLQCAGRRRRAIVNRSVADVCATCHIHATCHQIEGKSVCICNYGFVGNGRTHCQDKDECQIGASKICGNHTRCHNTHGSFYCVCLDGYRASNNNKTFIPNDGTNCTDIDECEESGLCGRNARCVNTEGSYKCYCNDGYKLENGERSFHPDGNIVSCKEIGCGSPPEMKHGYIVGNYSLLPGSAVHYECKEGFYSNEGKSSYCTAHETWEPATLSCKGVDCGVPPSVLNAHPASVSGTTYGSEVTYNCVHGYFIASGNQTAVCNAKGQWDGTDLVCKEIDCGKPLLIPHTEMIWDNSTTLWSRVYYQCKEGYYFNGDRNFSECTIDQSWENITYICKVKEAFNNILIFNDTCLKWRRNVRGTDVEDKYTFHVQGQRWYQKEFFHEMTFNLTTHKQAPEVCLDLQPGTNYSVNISMVALNFSLLVSMTTRITDPPFPDVEFVAVKGSAPLLRLRKAEDRNGPISLYQVIVLPLGLQSTFICDSFAAATFFSNTTDVKGYVAAEFQAKDVADNMSIALGDRHYYGKFYNAPLKLGEEYCVFLRIISEWNKVRTQSCAVWAQIKNLSPTLQYVTAVGLGSVAAVCLILFLSFSAAREHQTEFLAEIKAAPSQWKAEKGKPRCQLCSYLHSTVHSPPAALACEAVHLSATMDRAQTGITSSFLETENVSLL
ncbi:sushi domain-containing protein 1 isoform X3 [Gymnogyps californianus]|uniref:sushi domain-containing protein 1 isoform X3 n=1 Tax=Gymnogyps californianus TaxID=33616 RepID=UPI0021C90961|nr:sushi domain-containing protein 1 isoform X3 [Gymnogyps californianus]